MKVDIPENYLLIIAVRGNMGGGELPRSMQMWAQNICRKDEKMRSKLDELQVEWRNELSERLKNIEWITKDHAPS